MRWVYRSTCVCVLIGLLSGCTDRTAQPASSLSAGRVSSSRAGTREFKDFMTQVSALLDQKKFEDLKQMLPKHTLLLATALTDPGNLAMAKLLLENGLDPNLKDETGTSLLTLLCMTGKAPVDIVKLLLEHKADIDSRNYENATALMWAVQTRQKDVVTLLLEYGASIRMVNAQGNTAQAIAEQCKYRELIPLFASVRIGKHRQHMPAKQLAAAAAAAMPPVEKSKVDFKLHVKGTTVVGADAFATLVGGEVIHLGSTCKFKDPSGKDVGEYKVLEIAEDRVVVLFEGKQYTFDGSGLDQMLEK